MMRPAPGALSAAFALSTLLGCSADAPPILRAPVAHPIGPLVHVVTDSPAGAPEAVSVLGLEKQTKLVEQTMPGSGGDRTRDNDRSTLLVRQEVDVPRFVCVAPCDQTVLAKPDQELAIGGDGIVSSKPFKLDPSLAQVTLRVRRADFGTHVASKALLGAGAGVMALGLVLLPPGFLDDSTGVKVGSAISLGAGGASVILGAVLYATNVTRVEVIPGGVAF